MTGYTPGPWIVEGPDHFNDYTIRPADKQLAIAAVVNGAINDLAGHGDEHTSNARLIAAAPELLSIVRRFVALPSGAWHPERHAAEEIELMQDARAAIAKATQ